MYRGEKVNIIMPVYNEEKTLSEIIGRVLAQKPEGDKKTCRQGQEDNMAVQCL